MQKFLEAEMEQKSQDLKREPTAETYKNLAELVVTSLILFNRRRQGEASALKVQGYVAATTSKSAGNNPELLSALSDLEKHLARGLLKGL